MAGEGTLAEGGAKLALHHGDRVGNKGKRHSISVRYDHILRGGVMLCWL